MLCLPPCSGPLRPRCPPRPSPECQRFLPLCLQGSRTPGSRAYTLKLHFSCQSEYSSCHKNRGGRGNFPLCPRRDGRGGDRAGRPGGGWGAERRDKKGTFQPGNPQWGLSAAGSVSSAPQLSSGLRLGSPGRLRGLSSEAHEETGNQHPGTGSCGYF